MKEIFLSIVQGLTEFLPVSSSAHLSLIGNWMGMSNLLDKIVAAHVGTLIALVLFMYKDIIDALKPKNFKYLLKVALAIVPAGIVGILFSSEVEKAINSPRIIGAFLLFTALILYLTDFVKNKEKKEPTWLDSIIIGSMQALAIFPGISRSGMTISSSLFRKIQPEKAFNFSFLISIPVIFGAALMDFKHSTLTFSQFFDWKLVVPSFVFGYASLFLLKKVVIGNKLKYFAYYCATVGIITLIVG